MPALLKVYLCLFTHNSLKAVFFQRLLSWSVAASVLTEYAALQTERRVVLY